MVTGETELHVTQTHSKRFKRNRTTVFYKDKLWEMDLCDMRTLKEYNDGVTFLLTVIDVFSKYAFAKPLLDFFSNHVLHHIYSFIIGIYSPLYADDLDVYL